MDQRSSQAALILLKSVESSIREIRKNSLNGFYEQSQSVFVSAGIGGIKIIGGHGN